MKKMFVVVTRLGTDINTPEVFTERKGALGSLKGHYKAAFEAASDGLDREEKKALKENVCCDWKSGTYTIDTNDEYAEGCIHECEIKK